MLSYRPSKNASQSGPPPKLLDRVRDRIRRMGYSKLTGQSYAHWIKRLIFHHDKRPPAGMGKAKVESFPASLAVESAPTTGLSFPATRG
jgi:hypothetical protein